MVSHNDPATLIKALFEESPGLIRDDLAGRLNGEARWESDAFTEGIAEGNGILDFVDEVRAAFPDFRTEVTATFTGEKEDEVAFEFVFTGTNNGHLHGVGVTGRTVQLRANGIARFDRNSLLQDMRTSWNCAHLMAQLGVRPHMRADPVSRDSVTNS